MDKSPRSLTSIVEYQVQRWAAERAKIGVHTCPGGDQDSTHSADVDYAELLPLLFELKAGSFYVQLASESDRGRVLAIINEHARAGQRIFAGVIDPIDPTVETPEEVRDRVLEAAGTSWKHAVKVGVFLADLGNFAEMNEIYRRYLTPPFPARTTVEAGLAPGMGIEVDCIAVVPQE